MHQIKVCSDLQSGVFHKMVRGVQEVFQKGVDRGIHKRMQAGKGGRAKVVFVHFAVSAPPVVVSYEAGIAVETNPVGFEFVQFRENVTYIGMIGMTGRSEYILDRPFKSSSASFALFRTTICSPRAVA